MNFNQRMYELKEAGLEDFEIDEIRTSFRKLTSDTINETFISIDEEVSKTLSLTEKEMRFFNLIFQ